MIDFLQNSLRSLWEPMLWLPLWLRLLLVFLGLLLLLPWLLLRGIPWLSSQLSWIIYKVVYGFAVFLLWLEYQMTQRIRKKGSDPPQIVYFLGEFANLIVNLSHAIRLGLNKTWQTISQKSWRLPKKWLIRMSIIFMAIWFMPSFLRENPINQGMDNIISRWNKFEEWIVTNKSKISQKNAPATFVSNYFKKIQKRSYAEAYEDLSPQFQKNVSWNEYLYWWDKGVQRVEVKQISLLSKNVNSAEVKVDLQYLMKRTQKRVPESIKLSLIWDARKQRWLIDRSD